MKNKRKSWILVEAGKADDNKDMVILENPRARVYLDRILKEEFWPVIFSCLEGTGYLYSPELNIETEWGHIEMERVLSFMLFDDKRFELPRAIFRGKLSLSRTGWMLKREFFLPLPRHNDPQTVFEIIGNSRLRGNPPVLKIDKENENDFFQIGFNNGEGAGWGVYEEHYIIDKIKKIIDINVQMYEFSKEGLSLDQIGVFLTIAYEAYEAF